MKVFIAIFISVAALVIISRVSFDSQLAEGERKLEKAYNKIESLELEIEELEDEISEAEDCASQLNNGINDAMEAIDNKYFDDAYNYLYDTRSCR